MMGSLPATDVVDEAAGWLGWWALRRGRTGPVTRVADRPAKGVVGSPSRSTPAARWAGGVSVAYAAAFVLPAVPIAGFVLRERRLPWLWDLFPMYGGPWWDAMTINEFVASLGAFVAVNAVVAAGGILLWTGRRAGAWLSLAPLPLEVAFWIGYALPFPPLIALLRVALVVVAWRGLRAT